MCYPNGLDSWEGVPDGIGRAVAMIVIFIVSLAISVVIGG